MLAAPVRKHLLQKVRQPKHRLFCNELLALEHSQASTFYFFSLCNITSSARCQTARRALQAGNKKLLLSWDCQSHCSCLHSSHLWCEADKTVTESSSTLSCFPSCKSELELEEGKRQKWSILCSVAAVKTRIRSPKQLSEPKYIYPDFYRVTGSSFCTESGLPLT